MITAKKALVHWHRVAPNIRQLLALGLWRPFTHCPASGTAGFIQRRAESSGTSNFSAAWVTLPPVHPALHQQETVAGREFYRLGYPNREVREGLNESLLDYLTGKRGGRRSIWARCEGFRGRETSRGWRSASGRCSQRSRSTGTGAAGSTASRGTTRA